MVAKNTTVPLKALYAHLARAAKTSTPAPTPAESSSSPSVRAGNATAEASTTAPPAASASATSTPTPSVPQGPRPTVRASLKAFYACFPITPPKPAAPASSSETVRFVL